MKQNQIQSATSSEADNLVQSWLKLHSYPSFIEALQRFSKELDIALKARLPDGVFRGVMRGLEPDVRQDAAILLLDKYLAGNPHLVAETALGNIPGISIELNRSIGAAISICRKRLGERSKARRKVETELFSEDPRLPSVDSSPIKGLWQLPFALKHLLALRLLQKSVDSGQTKEESAELLRALLSGEITQAQLARKLGVSRSAVTQRLSMTTERLRRMAEDSEVFPE